VDLNAWTTGPLPVSHFLVKAARRLLLLGLRASDAGFSVADGHRPRGCGQIQLAMRDFWGWSSAGRSRTLTSVCRFVPVLGLPAAGWYGARCWPTASASGNGAGGCTP
jgi:hypothetical protein